MSNKPKRAKSNPIDVILRKKQAREQYLAHLARAEVLKFEKELKRLSTIEHKIKEPDVEHERTDQNPV